MTNAAKTKFLEKIADVLVSQAGPEEAVKLINEALLQYPPTTNNQEIGMNENQLGFRGKERIQVSPSMLQKYKPYFEAWLNVPIELMIQSKGVVITSNKKRHSKPIGWMTYIPLCAFETEQAVFISCIPEWESDIREALESVPVNEAINVLNRFSKMNELHVDGYHKIYGLEALNPLIDFTDAVLLGNDNYDQYWAFCKKTYPTMYSIIEQDDMIRDDYIKMVVKKRISALFKMEK